MTKRQQLVAMYSMLDHVAKESNQGGYVLVATLAAAAAEAVREELIAFDRRAGRQNGNAGVTSPRRREIVTSFA